MRTHISVQICVTSFDLLADVIITSNLLYVKFHLKILLKFYFFNLILVHLSILLPIVMLQRVNPYIYQFYFLELLHLYLQLCKLFHLLQLLFQMQMYLVLQLFYLLLREFLKLLFHPFFHSNMHMNNMLLLYIHHFDLMYQLPLNMNFLML